MNRNLNIKKLSNKETKWDIIIIGGGASGWSNTEWGGFPWGDATQARLKSKLPTGKASCLKIRFLNDNINENILLTKYELEIAAPYRLEIKE